MMAVFSALMSGCLPGAKPPYMVELYTLDYPSPVIAGTPMREAIKIHRFSVAQSYNSTAMLSKTEPYKVSTSPYDKWRVNPGDLVTDYFLRDLRGTGLFRAVFSYRDYEGARYVLEGGVEEFLQLKEKDRWTAIASLQATLLDVNQTDVTKRVIFQKRYRTVEPMTDESPAAFARGMSGAISKVSSEIIKDVYEILR